jgi:hypothetical protein
LGQDVDDGVADADDIESRGRHKGFSELMNEARRV